MKRPRAFALEPTNLDVSPASRFGEIVHLYKGPSEHPLAYEARFAKELITRLNELKFDAECDALILAGKLHSMVAMVAAAVVHFGKVNVLMFDHACRQYNRIIIGDSDDKRQSANVVL